MSEVNKVMEPIEWQCENAHLILGAVIDEAFTGRLSVTLIASQRRAAESPPPGESGLGAAGRRADEPEFLDPAAGPRPASRIVAPAPEMSNEKKEQMSTRQTGHARKKSARMQRGCHWR